MTNNKIFVTGGNGFIGSRVVYFLLKKGYNVRCLLRKTSMTQRIDNLDVERVIGDVCDPDSLLSGVRSCDGIIHLAGISNWSDIHSNSMQLVVAGGSKNLLSAAKICGNLRTVYISSTIAIDGTNSPQIQSEQNSFTLTNRKDYSYAFAKHEGEKFCQESFDDGLPVIIVNPAEVYGPNDRDLITSGNLVDFAHSNPVFVPSGGTSVVHVDDVAHGIIAAFEKGRPGERYILGGENLTIRDLAALTIKLLAQNKKIITLPNSIISGIAKLGKTLRIPLPFDPAVIPYAIKYWFIDNRKACRELDITFRSAHDTLAPTISWLQTNGNI